MSRPAKSCRPPPPTSTWRGSTERGSSRTWSAGRPSWRFEILADEQESRVAPEGRRRIGDQLVRAVAGVPVKVRTKLLIAFVGTSLLLVAVGLLGQLVLGRSNDRVGSFGSLQRRAIAYGQ